MTVCIYLCKPLCVRLVQRYVCEKLSKPVCIQLRIPVCCVEFRVPYSKVKFTQDYILACFLTKLFFKKLLKGKFFTCNQASLIFSHLGVRLGLVGLRGRKVAAVIP